MTPFVDHADFNHEHDLGFFRTYLFVEVFASQPCFCIYIDLAMENMAEVNAYTFFLRSLNIG